MLELAAVAGTQDRVVWVSRYTPDTGWTGLTYYGWDGTEANFPSIAGNWSSGSVCSAVLNRMFLVRCAAAANMARGFAEIENF